MSSITGGEYIIKFLKDNGYTRIFGIPGRRILPLFDAAQRDGDVEMVVTQHEEGAAFMADCYSRITSKGCCVGISGPGAINLLNGVASAYTDSIPLLVFAGQAQNANQGKYAIQEATGIGRTPNQYKMMESVTKHSCKVSDVKLLPELLEEAFTKAHTGRKGPVYIELPTDILDEKIAVDNKSLQVLLPEEKYPTLGSSVLDNVVDILEQSSKPLLLIGNGAVLSDAGEALKKFIELTNIPYATTLLAKGIIDEKLSGCLGCIGIWGQKSGNEYLLNNADVILALGTTFQELSTLSWRTLTGKKIIRVDIDENELNRNADPEVKVCNDIKNFMNSLIQYVETSNISLNFDSQTQFAESLKHKYGYYETSNLDEYKKNYSSKIQPYDALITISQTRPEDSILVMDVGENTYFSEFLIKSHVPKTYLQNAGLGSMGFAVAGSVGAAFADTGQEVIAITGDAGFLMNCNELATAAQYERKVIWCVFNNSIRGTQKHYQRDFCDGRYVGANVPTVDFIGLANSFGVKAERVHTLEELQYSILNAIECDGPALIDIVIDENTKPIPPFMF